MSGPIVERVLRSARYRDVDRTLVERLVAEEVALARTDDDAVKRVKRRLHQAVGAYRGASDTDRVLAPIRDRWNGDLSDEGVRATCRAALARHASTSERVPHLEGLYAPIWRLTGGPPETVLDLGCGIGPLALPWMGLARDARYHATDVDRRSLDIVAGFFELIGQSGSVKDRDLVRDVPEEAGDVALLLKLVPVLDRQADGAAERLINGLDVGHVVVSFPARSLGGHRRGMVETYRRRLTQLAAGVGRDVTGEASIPTELVFVLGSRG